MSSTAAHLPKGMVVIVWILLVTGPVVLAETGRLRRNLSSRKLEVQNHLERLDKSPVKTIRSPDGDIIDCVHIAHQPALNHPLLNNHKVQMEPSNYPDGVFGANKVHAKRTKKIYQLWHLNGRCPKGTVPIRRTKTDDIFRGSTLRTFERKKHNKTFPQGSSLNLEKDVQTAIAYLGDDKCYYGPKATKYYYGAKATINVWKPKVQRPSEYSSSRVRIHGGDSEYFCIVEAGWQVFPDLYKDNNTRFFGYWFSGKPNNPGCYDLLCQGFVQTDNTIAMGATLHPLSTYRGSQFEMNVSIWKDQQEGNWWLGFGYGIMVGYWPDEILPDLAHGANIIEWGGEITNTKMAGQQTTTQMGSGHFPQEGFGRASYFKNFRHVDASYLFKIPTDTEIYAAHPHCYGIQIGKLKSRELYFFYGGPGRNLPYCL